MEKKKVILVTGAAGFIGFHLSKYVIDRNVLVVGIDNINDYYDIKLKEDRIKLLEKKDDFMFCKGDISDKVFVEEVFEVYKPDIVINLAAQAGVRYSIEHPDSYIQSNLIGFFHLLEACRYHKVDHFVFASSSSVYGNQEKVPFSVSDNVDKPISLYAATKKSNELMGYTYSHLYGIPTTGLRFFTVYGPYGRPDMAYFNFTKKIYAGEAIQIFNHGDMYRDFTYIADVVYAVEKILWRPPVPDKDGNRFKVYNIGNSHPEKISYFIEILEKEIGREAQKEYLPMQPGDVYQTFADINELYMDFDFRPETTLAEGLKSFVKWYKDYYVIR